MKLNSQAIYNALIKKIQQLHGDFGVGATKTGLFIKYCNENTNLVIIRSRHGPHKFVASSLPILNNIENKSVVLNILYVGATLKQCFKFVLRHQREKYEEFVSNLKSEKEKQLLYKMMFYNDDEIAVES